MSQKVGSLLTSLKNNASQKYQQIKDAKAKQANPDGHEDSVQSSNDTVIKAPKEAVQFVIDDDEDEDEQTI